MEDEKKNEGTDPIIIDNGSFNIKAGFSGEEGPRKVLRNVIGEKISGDKKEVLIGEEALNKRSILNIKSPLKRAVIKDWDIMEKIWNYIFTNELNVDPKEYNVLITQPIKNIKENKEKIAEIMFESFNVPGLYLADSTLLSLYSEGKFTGLVIDMGDCITNFLLFVKDFCWKINMKELI